MALGKKIECCFMNGKSCIYERDIKKSLEKHDDNDKTAFMIMPFDKRLNALFQWEIVPFLTDKGYKCEKADEINRIGYIVCEKICKRIQEADLVVADISFNNPNVFYEIGLSIALQKPLMILCSSDKCDKTKDKEFLLDLKTKYGIDETKIIGYPKFDKLTLSDSEFQSKLISNYNNDFPDLLLKMNGNKTLVLYSGVNTVPEPGVQNTRVDPEKYSIHSFDYDLINFYKSAAGRALYDVLHDESHTWVDLYGNTEKTEIEVVGGLDLNAVGMRDVFNQLKDCCCTIIDITEVEHNVNYFWLGYIHGIGGNVIPINRKKDMTIAKEQELKANNGEIAFDIRALWHIIFDEANPMSLSAAFKDILTIIYKDKAATKNRDKFWESILKESEVSIFLGSSHLKSLGRNSIGDWDYRTAAEITSFLTNKKETIKVKLASPLPKRKNFSNEEAKKKYIKDLQNLLKKDKNCIIIASPDVNDLTEVALCAIYNDRQAFKKISSKDKEISGFIPHKVYKNKSNIDISHEHAFYSCEPGEKDERGFLIREKTHAPEPLLENHIYPDDAVCKQINTLLGLLVVAKNPYWENNKVIIISGMSGPSTFGIAQLLTGCVYDEFTIKSLITPSEYTETDNEAMEMIAGYLQEHMGKLNETEDTDRKNKKFYDIKVGGDKSIKNVSIDYEILSEKLITNITQKFDDKSTPGYTAIIEVGVYYPERESKEADYVKDDRKIVAYKYANLADMDNIQKNPRPIVTLSVE